MKKLIIAVIAIWVLVVAGGIAVFVFAQDDEPDRDDNTTPSRSPETDPTSSSTGSTPPGEVPAGLESFYTQQIDWAACGSELECGRLEVPVDYAEPDGETIMLNLKRALATGNDRIGSLVVNPGGPGAPGSNVAEDADFYFAPELRARYDIVGFDPRGTGDSSPIDCLTDAELDAYVAADPGPDDKAEIDQYVDGQADYWAGCEANTGDLLGHVSTIEVARDMDVMRAVLGEEKLAYFGFSYGTRLGATYAEIFPKNVGPFVLDGATDPSLSSYDSTLSQAKGFETAIRAYAQNCVDSGDCFLGDSVDAALATITGLLDDIDAKPLPTDQDRDLEIGNAIYGVITPLYNEDYWYLLDQGLEEALEGDGSTLLFLSDAYGSREGGRYTDNSLEAIAAINCLDNPWALDRQGARGVRRLRAGLADVRRRLRVVPHRLRRHPGGAERARHHHRRLRRGPDRGHRYDARPRDAVRRGRRDGRAARVRCPAEPRR